MSVNTDIYILTYKDKQLQTAIPLQNFRFIRFDDGIYGQVWDINNESYELKDTFKKQYNLTDEEYRLLQFYSCSESRNPHVLDEETGAPNFNKIPTDNVVKPVFLKEILEKVYNYETKKRREHDKSFRTDTTDNPDNKTSKSGPAWKNIFNSGDPSAEKKLEAVNKRIHQYLNSKPLVEFPALLAHFIGILTILESNDDLTVQIVFHES
jgi:hypothetical protein